MQSVRFLCQSCKVVKMKVKNLGFRFLLILVFFIENVPCEIVEFQVLKLLNEITESEIFLGRPPGANFSYNKPVIVLVRSFLRQLEKIDDKKMEIHLQMNVQLSWVDPRVPRELTSEPWPSNSSLQYATFRDSSKIWIPNVVFTNEKKSFDHSILTPSFYVRMYRNGSVLLNKRLSKIFDCPMNLRRFPFDVQTCSIQLSNYGDTLKYVQLFWTDKNSVQISPNFHVPNFDLENYLTMTKVLKTNYGEFSGISIDLVLSRNMHFYFSKFYLPVIVIVLISWIPFWLRRVLIIRIYIAFSSIIFLGWHYLAQPNDLIVSYFTYLDYWRGVNFLFVLSAAAESIFIIYMIKMNTNKIVRNHPDDSEKFKMLQCKDCPYKKKYLEEVDEKTDLDLEVMKIKANFKICFINVHKEVEIVDAVSKLFFPAAYCIFVFFYWLRCT